MSKLTKNGPMKMRPVTADHRMRRSYNRAMDEDDTNPYTSMYQAAFGPGEKGENKVSRVDLDDKHSYTFDRIKQKVSDIHSKFSSPQKKDNSRYARQKSSTLDVAAKADKVRQSMKIESRLIKDEDKEKYFKR